MAKLYEEQGLTRTEYFHIHVWLAKNRYKDECQHCKGGHKLQNALKEGCRYEMNLNNYITLCASCHVTYDKKIWAKTHTRKDTKKQLKQSA